MLAVQRVRCSTTVHAQDELARSVTMEQGKTLADAKGDVFRGLGEALRVCVWGGGGLLGPVAY